MAKVKDHGFTKKEDKAEEVKKFDTVEEILADYNELKEYNDGYFGVPKIADDGKTILQRVFDGKRLRLTDGVLFGIKKNIRITKKAFEINQDFFKDAYEIFKKKAEVDDEKLSDPKYNAKVNEDFGKYIQSEEVNKKYKELLKSECKVEKFYINKEEIEACIMPEFMEDFLIRRFTKAEEGEDK